MGGVFVFIHVLNISIFQQQYFSYSVWSVTHVSPPPAHPVKERIGFLASLPTLSYQVRELNEKACEHAVSRILLFAAMSGDYGCSFIWRHRGGRGLLTAKWTGCLLKLQ